MVPAGIAAAVVGVLMILASLKWRGRRYRPTDLADDVWIHRSDRAKLATASAETASAETAPVETTPVETTPETKGATS